MPNLNDLSDINGFNDFNDFSGAQLFRRLYQVHVGDLNYESVVPSDEDAIRAGLAKMDAAVSALSIAKRMTVRDLWANKKKEIEHVLEYGPYTRVSAMAAFILAGAYLREEIDQKPWIAQSILKAKASFKKNDAAEPFLLRLSKAYAKLPLKAGMKKRINQILSSGSPPRISQQLQNLDIVALKQAYLKFIERSMPLRQSGRVESNVVMSPVMSPSSVQLKPSALRCVKSLESDGDEAYILACFAYVK